MPQISPEACRVCRKCCQAPSCAWLGHTAVLGSCMLHVLRLRHAWQRRDLWHCTAQGSCRAVLRPLQGRLAGWPRQACAAQLA